MAQAGDNTVTDAAGILAAAGRAASQRTAAGASVEPALCGDLDMESAPTAPVL